MHPSIFIPDSAKRWLLPIIFCFLSTSICYGQPASGITNFATDNPMQSALDSSINKTVQQYLQDKKAVGISIGLLINNQSYFYNYGETKAGNNNLPNNKTVYEIGSITKAFTGILLAQGVLEKKLSLDDDIRKYLKSSYPNLEYRGVAIKIKDLSNHTSRITRIFPNMWERQEYDSLNPFCGYTKALLFEGLSKMKTDSFPGIAYSYSNMAVALLGAILEDVYNEDYYKLVSNYILFPCKMHNTYLDLSSVPAGIIAWPHDEYRKPVSLWHLFDVPAMGALRSTSSDMIRFIEANNRPISPAFALSHQPTWGNHDEGIGLNWFLHTSPEGIHVLEHGGGTGGSRSSLQCFPELNAGFVILTNSLANRRELEKEIAAIVISNSKTEK